jgi:hypothetical protein
LDLWWWPLPRGQWLPLALRLEGERQILSSLLLLGAVVFLTASFPLRRLGIGFPAILNSFFSENAGVRRVRVSCQIFTRARPWGASLRVDCDSRPPKTSSLFGKNHAPDRPREIALPAPVTFRPSLPILLDTNQCCRAKSLSASFLSNLHARPVVCSRLLYS